MKNYLSFTIIMMLSFNNASIAQLQDNWTKKNASEWFKKKEWLTPPTQQTLPKYDAFGRMLDDNTSAVDGIRKTYLNLQTLTPHKSIDKVEFAKQYHANQKLWQIAFSFLQTTDLSSINPGKHLIYKDDVYALVTEGAAKSEDTTNWEAHHNYIDIHYLIRGREKIQAAPLSAATLLIPYDPAKDIAFYSAKGKSYKAKTDNFFIFFPQDAHRPALQVKEGDTLKKIVLKVRVANHSG